MATTPVRTSLKWDVLVTKRQGLNRDLPPGKAGVAEGVIMKIGGWRTRSVFERYAIVSQSDIVEALGRLELRDGHSFGHSKPTEENLDDPAMLVNCANRKDLAIGAGRGSRTPKTRRSADFESAASASSAIPALLASA
jgi:hypothetical protein